MASKDVYTPAPEVSNFKFNVPVGAAEGLMTRYQQAPRSKFLTPHLNYQQHNFAFYFTALNAGLAAHLAFNHSSRARWWAKHRQGPYVLMGIMGAYCFVQTILPATSRRAFQGMDRYDRDWKTMPLDY